MGNLLPIWGHRRADKTYIQRVLSVERANLIGYWPMDETTGSTADNAEGTAARDGTYTGVTLGQSQAPFTCPLFDGASDYNNIYTASLVSAFSGAAGTVTMWAKVSGAGVWTDGASGYATKLEVDESNYVRVYKDGGNNTFTWIYSADGTPEVVQKSSLSETGWMQTAITWDKAGSGNMVAYYNGQPEGSAQAIAGTWAGSLNSATTIIGARHTTALNVFDGYLAHCAVWTKALSAAQILDLYNWAGV